MLSSLPQSTEAVAGCSTESVTCDWCDARPVLAFPTTKHCHCPLATTVSHLTQGSRLNWPEWLVTYEDGIS